MSFQQQDLLAVCQRSMPFGKYKDVLLADLPEPYLLWFADKGFPSGELGRLMALVLIIKMDGLESLLAPLRAGG